MHASLLVPAQLSKGENVKELFSKRNLFQRRTHSKAANQHSADKGGSYSTNISEGRYAHYATSITS
jgi:hypothetical protein